MRKIAPAALLVILIGATVFGFLQWVRRPKPIGTKLIASALPHELPPEPDVALQIDRESEPRVSRGAPLIFSVMLANPRAMNAALENEANQALAREIEAGIAAGKIASSVGIPANTASTHLSILTGAGLLSAYRDGRSIIYRANFSHFSELIGFMLEDCTENHPDAAVSLRSYFAGRTEHNGSASGAVRTAKS